MRVEITVTRVYEMDENRILGDRDFEPPPADATLHEKREWLRESFYELCGFERDQDHLDGSYVKLAHNGETADAWFLWSPELLG